MLTAREAIFVFEAETEDDLRALLRQPHEDDEVYVVLEGRGVLEIEGETVELEEGKAVFVPAGAEHRFVGYEQLSVPVIFAQPQNSD